LHIKSADNPSGTQAQNKKAQQNDTDNTDLCS